MKLRGKFEYRDAGSMMLWAFLAVQAAGFVLGLVAGAYDKPEWTEDILLAGTVTNAVMLIAYVVYTRKRSIPFSESTVTQKFSWWLVPVGIVATVALQYCTTGVLTLVDEGLSALGYTSVNSVVNTDFGARGALGYVGIALLMFVLPVALNLLISEFMRKKGWIKYGDMKLPD